MVNAIILKVMAASAEYAMRDEKMYGDILSLKTLQGLRHADEGGSAIAYVIKDENATSWGHSEIEGNRML